MTTPLFADIRIEELELDYTQPLGLFINNEFVKSNDGQYIESVNPSNGKFIVSFYAGTAEDVDRAVLAARNAYENCWSKISAEERGILLGKLCSLLDMNKKLLAAIDTLDAGKPYHSNSLNDVEQVIQLARYMAGAADKLNSGAISSVNSEKYAYTLKVPYGVVGQIVPWNYPLAMACWKALGCLAAGNCIVLKPAENTSLSILLFARLVKEAGFPPGVFNVIPGHGSVAGSRLASHPDVDKISFTGSTAVGQKVMALAAESNLKDVTLECGGKSPAIVFPDADLDEATKWISDGIFYNSGQNCTANSRVYVHESIYDKFIDQFQAYSRSKYSFGSRNPFNEDCTLGPVISKTQYEKINGYVQHGIEVEGLKSVHLGSKDFIAGYFIPPTILLDVPQSSKLCKEEIFGPVVVISKFKDYEEAISLANDTSYGLAACVFTTDFRRANRFVRDVKAGTVWVNSSNDEEISVPFGGFKMSGIGRELGPAGIETYLQTKAVHLNIGGPLDSKL